MPIAAQLYYFTYPAEPVKALPVVFIHGAGGTHLHWPAEVRRIPGYKVYAPDLPGHGKSNGAGSQTIEGYAQSLLAWMDALSLPGAVFAGHSMGSAIALALAARQPERVYALGLVGAGVRLPVHPAILADAASPTTHYRAIEMIARNCFSPEADPLLVQLAAARLAETRQSVFYGDFLACNAFDMTEQIEGIRQPALIVVGSHDQLTPPRYSQYLAARMPNAHLELVPQAGHMVMQEHPQVFARLLEKFLGDLPALPDFSLARPA